MNIDAKVYQNQEMDFRYFINFALNGELSWKVLAVFLDDLTPDLSKAKELNKILLEELEKQQGKSKTMQDNDEKSEENEDPLEPDEDESMPQEMKTEIESDPEEVSGENIQDPISMENQDEIDHENETLPKKEESDKNIEDSSTTDKGSSCNLSKKSIRKIIPKLDTSNNEGKIKCNLCGKFFQISIAFKNHMVLKHNGVIRKTFSKKAEEAEKEKNPIDTKVTKPTKPKGKKPLQCKICSKTLKGSESLKYHEKTHNQNQEKPYQCELCTKKFTSVRGLQYHIKIHAKLEEQSSKDDSDSSLIKCEICFKKLKSKGAMKYHEKTHDQSRKKEYDCEKCFKKFFNSNNLRNHENNVCSKNMSENSKAEI